MTPFKRAVLVLAFVVLDLLVLAGAASAAPQPKSVKRHALAKVGLAIAAAPKAAITTSGKGIKYTLGSVVFAVEAGNDVVLAGLTALDKGASVELKHNPFHYATVVDGKIDTGLEYVEEYFFGNPEVK